MPLFITFDFEGKCKRQQIWPQKNMSEKDLEQILKNSKYNVPDDHKYSDLVNLLISRLNVQFPVMYLLDTGDLLILDSQSITLGRNGNVAIGLTSKTYPIENEDIKKFNCNHLWKEFVKYQNYHPFSSPFVNEPIQNNNDLLLKTRDEIETLKKKLAKCKSKNTDEFEARAIYLEKILEEKNKAVIDLTDENRKLILENSQIQAQMQKIENDLENAKSKLATNPDSIIEIQNLKKSLSDCKQLLAF
jgi:hypothetical protein